MHCNRNAKGEGIILYDLLNKNKKKKIDSEKTKMNYVNTSMYCKAHVHSNLTKADTLCSTYCHLTDINQYLKNSRKPCGI